MFKIGTMNIELILFLYLEPFKFCTKNITKSVRHMNLKHLYYFEKLIGKLFFSKFFK